MENNNFSYYKTIEPRYSDYDHMQMVNNAVYMTYMEFGRMHYLTEICGWNWKETGVVVANAYLEFKTPIRFFEKPAVFIVCNNVGNKSFNLEYMIAEVQDGNPGKIFALAKTTMVTVDMKTGSSCPVPELYREKLTC